MATAADDREEKSVRERQREGERAFVVLSMLNKSFWSNSESEREKERFGISDNRKAPKALCLLGEELHAASPTNSSQQKHYLLIAFTSEATTRTTMESNITTNSQQRGAADNNQQNAATTKHKEVREEANATTTTTIHGQY